MESDSHLGVTQLVCSQQNGLLGNSNFQLLRKLKLSTFLISYLSRRKRANSELVRILSNPATLSQTSKDHVVTGSHQNKECTTSNMVELICFPRLTPPVSYVPLHHSHHSRGDHIARWSPVLPNLIFISKSHHPHASW